MANASCTLGLIRRNIKTPSTNVRDLASKTLARPKLEYASVAWSSWQSYLMITDAIEKVQRQAARYQSDSSVTTMIHNLNWKSLEMRRTSQFIYVCSIN